MGNPLGVYETMYKLKNEEKVFLREIWLASQNVTTRVSLLYKIISLLFKAAEIFVKQSGVS